MIDLNKSIVLYDDVCVLCQQSVRFILKHDATQSLCFSSLQSDVGKAILLQTTVKKIEKDSVLFWKNGQLYDQSTAAFKIASYFKGYLKLLQIFWLIPKPLRDYVYQIIAKNRYRWFGKTKTCLIPDNSQKHRFL